MTEKSYCELSGTIARIYFKTVAKLVTKFNLIVGLDTTHLYWDILESSEIHRMYDKAIISKTIN